LLSKKRGQVAIEYLLLIGVGLAIVSVGIYIIGFHLESQMTEKTRVVITDFGLGIQNELILASQVQEGYIRTLNLPDNLDGVNYNIINTNLSLTINYSRGTVTMLTPLTNGTFIKGENTIKSTEGVLQITN